MAPDHGNDVNRNVREVLLSEYAKEIGLTPQALHKRIKNGVLKGFQREEGGRKRWYVLIEDKSATESEPKEPKDDMYRELTAQSNQALIREQELNNKLIDQNRDLQEQLKEQRLLLHQGQEGATKGKWRQLPAIAFSLLFVGLVGSWFSWTERSKIANEDRNDYLREVDSLEGTIVAQGNLLQAIQSNVRSEREAWSKERNELGEKLTQSQKIELALRLDAQKAEEELKRARKEMERLQSDLAMLSANIQVSDNLSP